MVCTYVTRQAIATTFSLQLASSKSPSISLLFLIDGKLLTCWPDSHLPGCLATLLPSCLAASLAARMIFEAV